MTGAGIQHAANHAHFAISRQFFYVASSPRNACNACSPMDEPLTEPAGVGLAPGTIVAGKYRVDGFLGAGGMGVVLSATHVDLDAPVAIKLIREEHAQNEEVVARVMFEARAVARMRGAHVVRVLDVGRLPTGIPFIVMEQLAGADLAATLLRSGALPVRDAVEYMLQACEGLHEAHQLGIVHRDLKPENLFLANTRDGIVLKVLDFGISKDVGTSFQQSPRSAVTSAGFAVGSPYYMAPEQMRASLEIDSRADIWSLGAILFELLTGKCPFDGESLPVIFAKVLSDDAPLLRELADSAPLELDAIIRKCLTKDPNERFQTVNELATALREFSVSDGAAEAQRLASGVNLRSQPSATASPRNPTVRSDAPPPPTKRHHGLALVLALSTSFVVLAALGVGVRYVRGAAIRRASTTTPVAATPRAEQVTLSAAPHASATPEVAAQPASITPNNVEPAISITPVPASSSAPEHTSQPRHAGTPTPLAARTAPSETTPATATAEPSPAATAQPAADGVVLDVDQFGGRR
jgi:eukaryotic-like serine/threonine-protein kinase